MAASSYSSDLPHSNSSTSHLSTSPSIYISCSSPPAGPLCPLAEHHQVTHTAHTVFAWTGPRGVYCTSIHAVNWNLDGSLACMANVSASRLTGAHLLSLHTHTHIHMRYQNVCGCVCVSVCVKQRYWNERRAYDLVSKILFYVVCLWITELYREALHPSDRVLPSVLRDY